MSVSVIVPLQSMANGVGGQNMTNAQQTVEEVLKSGHVGVPIHLHNSAETTAEDQL